MIPEEEARHPSARRLDAVAAGDDAGPFRAHLAECAACAAYVARSRTEAEAFRAAADPAAFAKAIGVRAARPANRGVARGLRVATVVGPVLAAAAAITLWLRPSPLATEEGRFKGGVAVVAIRERDGHEERLTGPFAVLPSDRVRVEIALDHEEPVTAGLLADDGTWTILEAAVSLDAGTHYSDLAARFDDSPMHAFLLVGSPAKVDRARRSRDFAGIVAWRVTSGRAEEQHER